MAATTTSQRKLQEIMDTVYNNDLFDGSYTSSQRTNAITGEFVGTQERAEIWTDDEFRSDYMIVELKDGKIEWAAHWMIAAEGALDSTTPENQISLKGVADKLAETMRIEADKKFFGIV
tara:strand:+ start:2167 stop:2523 length:357 start_codon:yes stop_codon:yes gene_type:complete